MQRLRLNWNGLGSLWSRSNMQASRLKPLTVRALNRSQRKSSDIPFNLLYANEIRNAFALKCFLLFCDLRVLARKLARPFGHSMRVQPSTTCDYHCENVWPRLNRNKGREKETSSSLTRVYSQLFTFEFSQISHDSS